MRNPRKNSGHNDETLEPLNSPQDSNEPASAIVKQRTTWSSIFSNMAFSTFALLALASALGVFAIQLGSPLYNVPKPLADVLATANKSRYPSDITRDIIPKQIHSHNDYWRDVPFWSAISVGAVSVEADVWLYNGTLYVGHETNALTKERTFKSLYIDPILKVLHATNQPSVFVAEPTKNGIFDTASSQTLYLWIDVKTSGPPTFKAAIAALEPLRSAGWLTTYSTSTGVVPGPVTVIGTGNTPLNLVQGVSPRDYFWDAPLPDLDGTFRNITSDVSPIASARFGAIFGTMRTGEFNDTGIGILKEQIRVARQRGIGARYWDTPSWPLPARNKVWTRLWYEGVALVNVDDLVAGAGFADQANWWLPSPWA